MRVAAWMATATGRGVRIGAGLVLIGIGIGIGGLTGLIVALVGLVPILAGATNVCLVAPALRAPFHGRKVGVA